MCHIATFPQTRLLFASSTTTLLRLSHTHYSLQVYPGLCPAAHIKYHKSEIMADEEVDWGVVDDVIGVGATEGPWQNGNENAAEAGADGDVLSLGNDEREFPLISSRREKSCVCSHGVLMV